MNEEESEFDKILNNKDLDDASAQLLRLFAEGQVLKDILDVSDEHMQERYAYGHELFERKEFNDAAQVFGHLLTLNPLEKNYWISLGYSQIQLDNFQSAVAALSVASILDPDDPEHYYNSGLCYVTLGQHDEALSSFRQCVEVARKDYRFRAVEEKAQHWIEELE